MKNSETCICEREDWVYDSDVGQWCCGCGYVKNATGKGFTEGRLTLTEDGRIKFVVQPPKDRKMPLL